MEILLRRNSKLFKELTISLDFENIFKSVQGDSQYQEKINTIHNLLI